MFDYNDLRRSQKILLSLLETHVCNKFQIHYYLDFADPQSAYVTLARLKDSGYLKTLTTDNSTIGTVFSLTRNGYEYICSCAGIDSYVINENKEMIYKYDKALKNFSKKNIEHNTAVSDFYYILLKHNTFGTFSWEKESEVDPDNEAYNNVRGDAQFTLNNIDFIIEQDMGTETKSMLMSKFSGYFNALQDAYNLQTLLMPVNYEHDVIKTSGYINKKEYKDMMKALKSLRKELKKVKEEKESIIFDNLKICEFDKLTLDELLIMRKGMNEIMPIVQKAVKRKIDDGDLIISWIDRLIAIKNYERDSDYPNLNKNYEMLRLKIKTLTDMMESFKNEYIKEYNEIRYKKRIQMIKDIIATSDDFPKLLLRGMDFYINTQQNMKNFVEMYCLMKKSYKEYAVNLFRDIIRDKKYYFKITDYPSIETVNKYDTLAMSKGIRIEKYGSDGNLNSFAFLFEDISHGNYGAEYRIQEYMRNASHNELSKNQLVLICDNKEQIYEFKEDLLNVNNRMLVIETSDIEKALFDGTSSDEQILDKVKIYTLNDKNLYPINADYITNFIERS